MLNASLISRRAGFLALGVFAVACSDNAPTSFDSLGSTQTALQLASAQSGPVAAQSVTTSDAAALAVRLGARPTEIVVSVGGEVSRYDALVVATVEELSPGDTAIRRRLIAWQGGNRPVALLDVTTLGDHGSFSSEFEPASDPRARAEGHWYDFRRDSRWVATTGAAGISIAAIGESCKLADSRESDTRCSLADFSVMVDGLFRLEGASPDAGLPAVRIYTDAPRVNGVLIGSGDGPDRRRDHDRGRDRDRDRDPRRNPPTTTTRQTTTQQRGGR